MTQPYYQDELVTLYHGDCREILPTLTDRSIDCVITDPPYNERTHFNHRSNSHSATAGGRIISGSTAAFLSITDADLAAILRECGRVTRGWVVANMAYQHAFAYELDPPAGLKLIRIGVWVKKNPQPMISGDRPALGWEAVAYFHRADARPAWNGGGKAGNYVLPLEQNLGHPTAKPLSMVSDFVRRFTNPGDLVLDPFAGSGTTLRASVNEGRRAIGVEAEERYCELIAKRLDQMCFDFGEPA